LLVAVDPRHVDPGRWDERIEVVVPLADGGRVEEDERGVGALPQRRVGQAQEAAGEGGEPPHELLEWDAHLGGP